MGGRTGWKNWINAGARLVLLASGVYGCLLLLRSSDGIACSPWAVYGGTGVLCLFLWLSAGRGKGCVLALSALLLLGSGAALLLFLAGAVLAAVVSLLEFVLGDHWLLYLLTTALLLLPPFFGTDTELAPVLLLALFQLAFWGLRMAETDRKRFSFGGGDRHGTASAHRLPPARGDPVSAGICRRHLRGQPLGGGGRPQPVP